jgi:hypothetical protein
MIDLSASDQGELIAPPNAADVPLTDQISEVQREIAMRRKVFPHWVQIKKMTQADSDRHMLRMIAVLATLQGLAKAHA